jgi:hypothetical protein
MADRWILPLRSQNADFDSSARHPITNFKTGEAEFLGLADSIPVRLRRLGGVSATTGHNRKIATIDEMGSATALTQIPATASDFWWGRHAPTIETIRAASSQGQPK